MRVKSKQTLCNVWKQIMPRYMHYTLLTYYCYLTYSWVTMLYNTTVHLYTNITEALVPGTISFSAQLKHTIKFLLPSHFLWRLNIVSDLVINVRMSWKGKWKPRGPKRTNWRPRELVKRRNFKKRNEKRGKNFLLVLKKRESNNKANSWF